MYNNDTIAALATPPGIGALAIIRISGENLAPLFQKLTKNKAVKDRFATFSSIYCPNTHDVLDSGLIVYFKAPKSFTGEDLIEINCHGGEYISKSILESLYAFNVRPANPGEFSFRAFMNGKIDLIQAEAISELISSKSSLAVKNNLNSVNGYVSNYIDNLKNKLINLLSLIEHELDFTEEELESTRYELLINKLIEINDGISKIANTSAMGKMLSSGARVVLLGPPNAGKSSLFNAILGFDRAIVSEISGTTRDVVESWFELKGIPVCLIDTAGYWDSDNYLESMGIERTKQQIELADIILFVDDKYPEETFQNLNLDINNSKIIFINSKSDLEEKTINSNKNSLLISSKKNEGIDTLLNMLSTKLSSVFGAHSDFDPIIISKRQRNLLLEAYSISQQAIVLAKNNIETDILASTLHGLNDTLSEIIGNVSSSDVVNNIFSEFCVGK
ncbi:MAG: tRNA uridine-5-carboxymethylaminomethyl(34) synthesis GTPase MnmE [Candidatus Marinimicrobia bacterium]|nr:tRNA uridine-5-carboxymethylaminomethyl(34) synthesis GTPase MnmE [Candidatus Neomarinimicrobiota bacterium]MBT5955627.1 tRNA uridine-5-carboxymethylaminomethyl(34) synthesis GTPase MnmE [Candidatus Neomarinimicrobiota bacterium]MBT6870161.1 tRNA uridine-5-carboxymethylaminomethyl(34) synthesis GTPase MnmE [Candidatus Neomarinimicrobiota bacterium]MBT7377845.1 tRNA uridine-5-carboxymethylaminomethyl(34) synthesis GTPase MnmE [Candidatus Neomarinimicrobiota bacterium]|tara:strand:+ start:4621 stop:5964 length:1344 start_codon:yes stop_codon:yes gene_type:complete